MKLSCMSLASIVFAITSLNGPTKAADNAPSMVSAVSVRAQQISRSEAALGVPRDGSQLDLFGANQYYTEFDRYPFQRVSAEEIKLRPFPYKLIGQLSNGCTGSLIGPHHVLTAGHCVFGQFLSGPQEGQWGWENVKWFYPGRNGEVTPPLSARVIESLVDKRWHDSHLSDSDYALVILDRDIATRWLQFGYESTFPVRVNLIGYPVGHPSDKPPKNSMWASFCPLAHASPLQYKYKCSQWPGNSGSGLLYITDDRKTYKIVGVATKSALWHVAQGHKLEPKIFNTGVRISEDRQKQIERWIKGDRNDAISHTPQVSLGAVMPSPTR
jgi:V8-like Glu-specific endopeptidase